MANRQPQKPISQAWAWQLDAACRGMPSSHFFHPWNERGTGREDRIRKAKLICADCPVIDPCRLHALQTLEMYGIWGGLSEDERLILLNRHRNRSRVDREADLSMSSRRPAHQRQTD